MAPGMSGVGGHIPETWNACMLVISMHPTWNVCRIYLASKHGSYKCLLSVKFVKGTIGHAMWGCLILQGLVTSRQESILKLVHSDLTQRNPSSSDELEARPQANVANHKPGIVATNITMKAAPNCQLLSLQRSWPGHNKYLEEIFLFPKDMSQTRLGQPQHLQGPL